MYELILSKEAARFYRSSDAPVVRKLDRCFDALRSDPRAGNNVKTLKGDYAGALRYRVGDLRVVYTVSESTVTVYVITIADRKDVYD